MLAAFRRALSDPSSRRGLSSSLRGRTRPTPAQTRAYSDRPIIQRGTRRFGGLDAAGYIGGGIGLAIGAYWISHMENAPLTNRRRFMVVSKEEEEQMRRQVLQETLREYEGRLLPAQHPLTLQVKRIVRRILTASDLGYIRGEEPKATYDSWGAAAFIDDEAVPRPSTVSREKEWTVLVVNDPKFVNAFAAPGLVCVSTGIMPVAGDEEGLAAVIGHEIGHVVMRHSAEHLSKMKLLWPIMMLMWAAGIDPLATQAMSHFFYFLPHSRSLETEADLVGIKLIARACYHPIAAPRFFQNLQIRENGHVPEFLSTHPSTPGRIAHLTTLVPESMKIYEANPECARLNEMRARGIIGRKTMHIDSNPGNGRPRSEFTSFGA
ncbi:Peptidase-M48 domain-containing protein [Mycena chlorophos]|uniref:Peptidase-M48 domain-containing protein n=1 Tax=Mycena chlorophos TaxID=658473 RepID=A0A8H6TLB3_MYCCL|nr:Peptidase-M48 domain-containing protein [Mycena chlorophos]